MSNSVIEPTNESFFFEPFESPKKKEPGHITLAFAKMFPQTGCWGYGNLRRISPESRWMYGKIEKADRVLFPQFYTVWKHGDFAWGVFRSFELEEFNTLIKALMNNGDYDNDEDIDALAQHLKKFELSSPFETRAEVEGQAILEAVATRAGYQEDEFPINYGWAPPKSNPVAPSVMQKMCERLNASVKKTKQQAAKIS